MVFSSRIESFCLVPRSTAASPVGQTMPDLSRSELRTPCHTRQAVTGFASHSLRIKLRLELGYNAVFDEIVASHVSRSDIGIGSTG
jgi:hypothetical protein